MFKTYYCKKNVLPKNFITPGQAGSYELLHLKAIQIKTSIVPDI